LKHLKYKKFTTQLQSSSSSSLTAPGYEHFCQLVGQCNGTLTIRVRTDIKMFLPDIPGLAKIKFQGFPGLKNPFFQDFPGHAPFTNMGCVRLKKCIYKISYQRVSELQ